MHFVYLKVLTNFTSNQLLTSYFLFTQIFFYPQKGVAYISRKSDKLGKQQNVDSPHSCQEICAETPNCLYWTWLEKKKRKKVKQICKLRSGVRKSGFRRQKDKAVSGKEVHIVYRLFLVNCYQLHGNIQSKTEADRDRSIYYLRGRFSGSLNWLELA